MSAGWLHWAPPDWLDRGAAGSARRRLVDAYVRRFPPCRPLQGADLQLGKLVAPIATTAGWRAAAGVALALTDRPNVATALERRRRKLALHRPAVG